MISWPNSICEWRACSAFRPAARFAHILGLTLTLLLGSKAVVWGAESSPFQPATLIDRPVIERMRAILASVLVELSIETQNREYGNLPQSQIKQLDEQWRAERGTLDKPLIAMTLSNPLSTYLTRMQADALGLYSAIFVMDRNGLNVGQSAITSDYWQGDEAKFQKTFQVGPEAIFIDEPEYVDDFDIWISQVNMTIASRTTGQPIGSASFDVNLNELARRRQSNGS